MLEITLAIFGAITSLITIFTTYSKLQAVLSRLEFRDLELREQMKQIDLKLEHTKDQIELWCNGNSERIEHINTRLSNQMKELTNAVIDVEAFLQKKTEYEKRNR